MYTLTGIFDFLNFSGGQAKGLCQGGHVGFHDLQLIAGLKGRGFFSRPGRLDDGRQANMK